MKINQFAEPARKIGKGQQAAETGHHHEGLLDDLKLVEELVVNPFQRLGFRPELIVRSLQHLELLERLFRLRLLGDQDLERANRRETCRIVDVREGGGRGVRPLFADRVMRYHLFV